ncbi:MAG: thiamine phosphate synthase [Herminiimonas sp.]|nr:thiamine phosphate synthase [Herminiimonas sp.]
MKGLYIVTPDWDDTQQLVDITEQALRGGAMLVQYRHKTAGEALRREQAGRLLELCRRYGRPLVINDFVALCNELGADGVHVGGTDASVAQVREALGPAKIVGASCYGSLQLACDAYQAGASYVAFGGFYPSRVKKYPVTTPREIIQQAKEQQPLPAVVIGGMTHDNALVLVESGADMVAAISSVYTAADPEAAARGFARMFSSP